MGGLKEKKGKQIRPFLSAFSLILIASFFIFFSSTPFYKEQKEKFSYFLQETALFADFGLTEIYVQGRNRTPSKELYAVLDIQKGQAITSIDLPKTRERLQRLPWVKNVYIERRLPHILYVKITERTPIAVWQEKGVYRPIDTLGQPVETTVTKLNNLPLITGKEAPQQTPYLLNFLAEEQDIFNRVKAASFISNRRWDIFLDDTENGIKVRLPERNAPEAWGRLAKLSRAQEILERKIKLIDLRQPDKVIVRMQDAPKKRK